MKLQDVTSYEQLETFFREMHSWRGDTDDFEVYDFSSVFYLWTALLDNMRTRSLDADLEQYAEEMLPEQVPFFATPPGTC